MTAIYPLAFRWSGEAMEPINPKLADKQYVVGEIYRLEPREDRSEASHSHYFAALNEAHKNLPEYLAEQFPTVDHLRKWALIKAGHCDQRSVVVASRAEALRLVAFMKPIDQYAVVVAVNATVTVYTAKSQSMRAMGKQVFEDSKTAVLEIAAQMVGTSTETLQQNAGKAA